MCGLMKTTVLAVSALAVLSPGLASANLVLNYASNSPILAGSPPATPGTYLTATFANSVDDASILAGHVRLTLAVPTEVPGLFVGVRSRRCQGFRRKSHDLRPERAFSPDDDRA